MRLAIALSVLLAMTACQNAKNDPPPIPTIVEVPVTKYVQVPAELAADCQNEKPQEQTYAEAKRLALVRGEYLDECTKRMKRIRALGTP